MYEVVYHPTHASQSHPPFTTLNVSGEVTKNGCSYVVSVHSISQGFYPRRTHKLLAHRKRQINTCGAEGLVVRVVVSVEKQLAVRQQFIDILHGEA